MKFEFSTATKIIFGTESSSQLPELVQQSGKRPLVLIGTKKIGTHLLSPDQNWDYLRFEVVDGEPSLPILEDIIHSARRDGVDVIISIGGGSVIDMGKALSGLVSNPGDIRDYLEVVGKNKPLQQKPIPFIALPTTAGTGAEVTRNAVISVPEKKVKVSLRSPYLYPAIAIVDPSLTYSMPAEVTAHTGLDALTQVLEPFVSIKANGMVDLFCREGLSHIGRSLFNAFKDGNDRMAREDMCWGSLLGGLALSNGGLGAVHGFAGPIGGMYDIPHGAICAALLPHVTQKNIEALEKRDPHCAALVRYRQAGNYLFGGEKSDITELISGLFRLNSALKIRSLGEWGVEKRDVPNIVDKARQASSMKGNPISLEDGELSQILMDAI
jgi:alcohol dehydrogenase class IV